MSNPSSHSCTGKYRNSMFNYFPMLELCMMYNLEMQGKLYRVNVRGHVQIKG